MPKRSRGAETRSARLPPCVQTPLSPTHAESRRLFRQIPHPLNIDTHYPPLGQSQPETAPVRGSVGSASCSQGALAAARYAPALRAARRRQANAILRSTKPPGAAPLGFRFPPLAAQSQLARWKGTERGDVQGFSNHELPITSSRLTAGSRFRPAATSPADTTSAPG